MDESDLNISASVLTQYSKELKCPLTQWLLYYPVITNCGHTFSQYDIKHHLRNDPRCPICSKHVEQAQLKPNFVVRNLVQTQKRLKQQQLKRDLKRFQKKRLQYQAAKRERRQSQLAAKRKREQYQQKLRQQAAEIDLIKQLNFRKMMVVVKIVVIIAILVVIMIIGHNQRSKYLFGPRIELVVREYINGQIVWIDNMKSLQQMQLGEQQQ